MRADTVASLFRDFGDALRSLFEREMPITIVAGSNPRTRRPRAICSRACTIGQVVRKVAGQRVTSEDDVFAVTASLAGTVNVGLCAALVTAGVRLGSCGTPVRRVRSAERSGTRPALRHITAPCMHRSTC